MYRGISYKQLCYSSNELCKWVACSSRKLNPNRTFSLPFNSREQIQTGSHFKLTNWRQQFPVLICLSFVCVVMVVRDSDILKVLLCTIWHSPRKYGILGVNKVTIPSQLVFEQMKITYSLFGMSIWPNEKTFGASKIKFFPNSWFSRFW